MALSGVCVDLPCMTVCSPDERLAGKVFDDSPTGRLCSDDGLVDDWDDIAPQPRSGALVVRIEKDRRRAWLRPVVLVLTGASLALTVSFILRSKSSRTHSAGSTVPRAPSSRPSPRRVHAGGHRGPQRMARRAVRSRARHSRLALGRELTPRRVLRPAVSVAPSSGGYVSPRSSEPTPPRRREEFGFER
jgi:hypothetical protein